MVECNGAESRWRFHASGFLTVPAFVVLGPFGRAFSLMSRDQCCVSEGRLQNGGTAATQRRVVFFNHSTFAVDLLKTSHWRIGIPGLTSNAQVMAA